MDEFKIHHFVSELIRIFGRSVGDAKEISSSGVYVEHLKKNRIPYLTARTLSVSTLRKLCARASDGNAVQKKIEDLRGKSLRELDSFVHMVYELASNEKVKRFLKQTYKNTKKSENKEARYEIEDNAEINFISVFQSGNNELMTKCISTYQKDYKRKMDFNKFPEWINDHNYIKWDFAAVPCQDNIKIGPVGALPKSTQETLLIRDLLFCLSGVEGDYVILHMSQEVNGTKMFVIDKTLDCRIAELANRFLPVLSDYSTVVNFIEEKSHFQYGSVNHALSAAMWDVLKDHFILIAQLEHQYLASNLSLQKMWFYLQQTISKLHVLADIASTINKGECYGSVVLSVLHEKSFTLVGDITAQDICCHLAKSASTPYFEILEKWIYQGIISDPYCEFLVEDNEMRLKDDLPSEYSDDYWEKRYTIRREQIPVFLEKVVDMILRTGKYLNVIRQCGSIIKIPSSKSLVYMPREQFYFEVIYEAYRFASKKLLDLLLTDNDLKGRLRSLKHYFLLDQGDFIVQFLDMAEEELCKDIDDIMPTRLESLLELALRTSAVNSDKYKDDVKVELLPYDLLTQLFKILMVPPEEERGSGLVPDAPITGLEALTFDYEVGWPLSLVVNKKALACYQLLFRHLFYCKHVERLLGRVWILNKSAKINQLGILSSYSSAFALCQRMLHFIQNLDYYITLEVIEPHWESFRRKMLQVSNVDDVLECHTDFLNSCLSDCMLTAPKLLQALGKLLKICMSFSSFMQETHRDDTGVELNSASLNISVISSESFGKKKPGRYLSESSFEESILHYQKEFDVHFIHLLEMIADFNASKSSTKMANMIYRLDFSEFYANNSESLNNSDQKI